MRPIYRRNLSAFIAVSYLLGCSPAETSRAANEPHSGSSAQTNASTPQDVPEGIPEDAREYAHENIPSAPLPAQALDVRFQDVLNQYMGLNERLGRIASRLKISNADICPATEADIGLTTHTLSDYPEELRPAAQHYLNVGSDMSIRTVRAGSPAARAGLLSGDRIAAINGESLIDGPLFDDPRLKGAMGKALFHTALNGLDQGDTAQILLKRNDRSLTATLPITRQCELPVTLFFSEDVNGHYIDGEIWMTSGLLQEVREDIRVAYIMAHEMAHALKHDKEDGQETEARTPEIELDADRIGLILLARAGYDAAKLASFWAEQVYLFDGGADSTSKSHPDLKRRAENFALTLSYIRAAGGDKDKLKALVIAP